MPDKTYLVKFKNPELPPQLVRAATIEIHGEHLVFCRVDGGIAALFLVERPQFIKDIAAKAAGSHRVRQHRDG